MLKKNSGYWGVLFIGAAALSACEPTSFYTSPTASSSNNSTIDNPPPGPIPGQPNSFQTNEDTTLSSNVTYSGASSVSNLSYQQVTAPQHGTLSLTQNGSFVYSPSLNYNGTDTFTFRASYYSSTTGSASQVISASIRINPVNDAPTASNITLAALVNTALDFTIGSNNEIADVDDALASLRVTIANPTNASGAITVLNATTRQFRFTPTAGFRGSASFQYTVTDPQGASSAAATLSINVGGTVASMRPALAMRGMGCITCHANIHSNVITDFGYGGDGNGTNYFFGVDSAGNPPTGIPGALNGSIYGDHGGTSFGSATILNSSSSNVPGAVYVPRTSAIPVSQIPQTLAGYLTAAFNGYAIKPTIIEQSSVYIGAPSVQTLQNAAIQKTGSQVATGAWKYIKHSASSPELSGLVYGDYNGYVRNAANSELVCEGDLIVNAPLFLDKLSIRTTDSGCRIYATRSVFIQGTINYLGSSPNRNLQISSSRAIMLGLGKVPQPIYMYHKTASFAGEIEPNDTLAFRVLTFWTRNGYFTREPGSISQKLAAIHEDSATINLPGATPKMWDAAAPNGVLASDNNQINYPIENQNRNVSFERLLLNAPHIESRYTGNVKGVVISEIGLFALGEFKFEFDPVFSVTPILPLLQEKDYLQVTP